MTAKEAWAKKEANNAKRKAILDKKRATLVWVTRNKIKNNLKACRVIARRRKRERKKVVEALEKAKEFVPVEMLKAIPDPEQTTTEADIKLQLQEALVSTIAAIDPSLDASFSTTTEALNTDPMVSQDDFIPFIGLDSGDTGWNYLDADDDADTGLF